MNHKMTRNTGAFVGDDNNSITTEDPFVTTLNDVHLLEKHGHFNRERIPERVVHAKGAGAYGEFVCTNNLTNYTCLNFLNRVGKRTKVLARFSTVAGEKGSSDVKRDPRGFAVRFYTEEGNYDIVGNNTPIFFIRDAMKFPDFIHSQKRDPQTNLTNYNAFWDFLSLTPESVFQVIRLFTDLGTPDGFRHMDGFGTNTFIWYPNLKEYYYVKYHWKTRQGIKNLTNEESVKISGENPDYSTQDLYKAIETGNYPMWDLYVQILTPEQARNYKYNIFEVTKIIYEEDYPLIKVGTMVLNKNPENFFNDIEQAAFCPGNIVRGVALSPDKMLNARAVMYSDTQRHRIGANFMQLPVNKPMNEVNNYQQDGAMNLKNNKEPNYFPNSFGGPAPTPEGLIPPLPIKEGYLAQHNMPVTEIDYEQPRRFYEELTEDEKNALIHNIEVHLKNAMERIQYKQTAVFYKVSKDYGTKVANALGLDPQKVAYLAMQM